MHQLGEDRIGLKRLLAAKQGLDVLLQLGIRAAEATEQARAGAYGLQYEARTVAGTAVQGVRGRQAPEHRKDIRQWRCVFDRKLAYILFVQIYLRLPLRPGAFEQVNQAPRAPLLARRLRLGHTAKLEVGKEMLVTSAAGID